MTNDNARQDSQAGGDGSSLDRRQLLRGVAAGGAALVGLPGTAAATGTETLDSADAVRDAFADHEDLLADLADRGLLATASAADLALDPYGGPRDGAREFVRTVPTPEGGWATEAVLVRRTDRGWLSVGVQPATGDRFAALRTEDGDTVTIEADCCSSCQSEGCCEFDEQLKCVSTCIICQCRCA